MANSSDHDPRAQRTAWILRSLAVPLLCAAQGPSARGQCVAAETVRLAPEDLVAGDLFGRALALDGDVALIGMSGDGGGPWASGSVRVLRFDGALWNPEAELISSQPMKNDEFGISVALDGDLAIVGAYVADPNGLPDAGSAFVFRHDGSTWNLEARLVAPPSEADAYDWFGRSVSIEGDLAVVGAHGEDDLGSASGSAYVFRHSAGAWLLEAKLTASNGATGDNFGLSLDLSDATLIVGAWSHDGAGYDVGAAYVFEHDGLGWQESAMLIAADGTNDDEFGFSVALDGSTALVGAYNDDANATAAGSAYVFTSNGTVWNQEAKLTPSNPAASDRFGSCVSIDAGTALIGANQFLSGPGHAYVFQLDGGSWTERARLVASDAEGGDIFGWSVALSGNTGLVGAISTDLNLGTTYLYSGVARDCNGSGALDLCDLANGTSSDCDGDGVLDECDPIGEPRCPSVPNSSGQVATLSAVGGTCTGSSELILTVSGLPTVADGSLFMSLPGGRRMTYPFIFGTLCVGHPALLARAQPGSTGNFTYRLDLAHLPPGVPILPGETHTFQMVFRDSLDVSVPYVSGALDVLFQ